MNSLYRFLFIILLLFSCENPKPSAPQNPLQKDDFIEKKEYKSVDPQTFPQGLWIGKSYYDSLQKGKLTPLFIENHLKTYVSEHQGHLEIGNAYGFESGIVSMTEKNYRFEPSNQEKERDYFFNVKEENNSLLLSTNFYWGVRYIDEMNKDTLYIKVSADSEDNRHDGHYHLEFPIESLYFSGKYTVLDKKNNQSYPNVTIENQTIQNFIKGKNYPFRYEALFPGSHVIYIALEEKFGRGYSLEYSKRAYYLPSERKYFVVEDTEKGFQLFELLQPSLKNPKGCVEAHDIESEAEKGELLFDFTKTN
ncbi:hypothetical protein [Aureispira anguillae]|uniref:Lipoprotein n=1 Tax=Aureispira anguillae TaxID=2864201 RepID=A0A915YE15_9BACT|nr:hypothetical protein [Aureispira anguillae]BDS11384.1 hypothetical protein AsAng_0020980 [Aureispira anguillae]